MTGKIKALQKSQDNSIEVSSASDSRSDDADGAFNEGKVTGTSAAIDISAQPKGLVPVCPTPVRIVVGVFSGLLTVGGCAMAVIGFKGSLNSPDPDPSLHAGLLGSGLTLVAAGALGVLSVFFEREQAQSSEAHA